MMFSRRGGGANRRAMPPEEPQGRILPECPGTRRFERYPDLPVAAGRAGAPLRAIPAATNAQAADGFSRNGHGARLLSRLPFAAPVFAGGAALLVRSLDQQVFAARQAAMLSAAGTTAPPLPIQPLMPFFTL